MKKTAFLLLGAAACLAAGCVSKAELRQKFVVEKWPLMVHHEKYEATAEVKENAGPGLMTRTRALAAPPTDLFDGVLGIFTEEMQKAFPEIKVERTDLPMDQWSPRYDHHVVAEIWPAAEWKTMGGSQFRCHLIVKYKFYKVEEGRVRLMGSLVHELARVYGEKFDAGTANPTYGELAVVHPETLLLDALEAEVRTELADFIRDIHEAGD